MINDAVRGYFGFERLPFDRSVPVGALFASASHQEAAGRIAYGIDTRQITVITGEVGAGKTVAARAATARLDASRHQLIAIPNPQVGARGIHHAVVAALGGVPRVHHATLIPQAAEYLAAELAERGRLPVLLIDEAHLLSHDQLEAIRMLTLCRDRDYAGGRQGGSGGRVHACQASGIIPGPRGTRGACPAAGTCLSSSLVTRSGRGPSP
jgi:type II secretory pathway predicted ATPase ExeA